MQSLKQSVGDLAIDGQRSSNSDHQRRNVRNLLTVSMDEKRRFMQSFDDILTDCDGTVWQFNGILDGVGKAIGRLEQIGKRVIYITNNSMRSDDEYQKKFLDSGIVAEMDNVMHPAVSTVEYLRQRNFTGLAYTIGSPVFRSALQAAGFNTIDGPRELGDEKFSTLWKLIKDDHQVDAVVIDTDVHLAIAKLLRAQLYLQKNPQCLFLVGTTDMILSIGDYKLIGPGNFYKALEQTIGRKAVIVGKPGLELANLIVKKYKLRDRKRVLFIGDMLEQDVGFGNAAGFQSLLVLTGGTALEDLQTHPQLDELPNYYLNSFADFTTILNELAADDNK